MEPDWAEHLWLDRISLPDLNVPGWTDTEKQAFGVVAEVPSRRGEQVTIVIQVEPEALTPTELSRRLGGYFMDLEIHYCRPVLLSVLYLHGGRPGINLETAPVSRLSDMDLLRIYFTAFGLEGSRAEYYLERPEPLAWALSALMQPVRHSRRATGALPRTHRRRRPRRGAPHGSGALRRGVSGRSGLTRLLRIM